MRTALWTIRICTGTVLGLATWAMFAQVNLLVVLREIVGAVLPIL